MRSTTLRAKRSRPAVVPMACAAQATTEYILLLAIVVALAIAVLRPLRALYQTSFKSAFERSINKTMSDSVYCYPVNGSCQ